MPKLSVVSGTWNRLSLLQEMVESVRVSAGSLPLEIIIVDGGSTDGTLKWCRKQPDIRLIEHGELRGAIKAYNDGLFAAQGEYVVVMNDDARLIGNTLVTAAKYLDEHSDVGQAAFKNVINNPDPARPRAAYGQAFGYLYGQCCMTRKWLGDLAGWWGDDYYTYAGDTQLGLRVWELGYKVIAVDGCAVMDRVYSDELREVNNDGIKEKTDSRLFFTLWKDRMPSVSEWRSATLSDLHEKVARKQLKTLRFKAVPQGSQPRRGMIEAFSVYGPARQINQTDIVDKHGRAEFQNIAIGIVKEHRPDLLILQAQGPDNFTPETVAYLHKLFPQMKIVNFNGDARVPVPEFNIAMARECHLSLIVSPDLFAEYARGGARNVAYWPISFEPDFSVSREKLFDPQAEASIVFMGSNYGTETLPSARLRQEMVMRFALSDLSLRVYGNGWNSDVSARPTYEDHAGNAQIYAQATMGISISHFDNLWGYSSDRLYMLCATGCPALVKMFKGMEAHGFVDGETCIAWDSLDELEEKARYYLQHADEREAIGKRGQEMTLTRHSWQRRADDLLNMLRVNAPVGGDHSSTYIANHGLGARHEQPRQYAPNVQRQAGVLPGSAGMTLIEYLGGNHGTETWYGAYAAYVFSKSQPLAWVDKRDVPTLLERVENRRKLFREAKSVAV